MNEQFKNLVVKIESEEMLQQAREIIERNGQFEKICALNFFIGANKDANFLRFCREDKVWELFIKQKISIIITLQEFEELFNTGNNGKFEKQNL